MTDDVNQTKCLINTHGWQWMRGHFDRLPQTVRKRLARSPFNLCPACLELEVLPKVQAKRAGAPHGPIPVSKSTWCGRRKSQAIWPCLLLFVCLLVGLFLGICFV